MTGNERTRWKCNGLRMKGWKRSWNKEEAEGVPLQAEVLQKVPELVVHQRMSQHKRNRRKSKDGPRRR